MALVVGIDPGKANGVAVWDTTTHALHELTGEYDTERFYALLDVICEHADSVQVERFTISARTIKTAVDYSALHNIGAVLYAAWKCGYPVSFTNPSDVKMRFPDASLRKVGLWHKSDHVRDATRHLLIQLVKLGEVDPKSLIL